jgi:hypothetical protein
MQGWRNLMRTIPWRCPPLAVPVLLAVIAGCGPATGSGASPGTPDATGQIQESTPRAAASSGAVTGPAGIHPGSDTPRDAVYGLLQAELAGNLVLACSYFVPSVQSNCQQTFQASPDTIRFTGSLAIGNQAVSGIWAVVAVTGHACVTAPAGNSCSSNSNRSAGLPAGSETVHQAEAKALTGSTLSSFSPVPCENVAGKWYVVSNTS